MRKADRQELQGDGWRLRVASPGKSSHAGSLCGFYLLYFFFFNLCVSWCFCCIRKGCEPLHAPSSQLTFVISEVGSILPLFIEREAKAQGNLPEVPAERMELGLSLGSLALESVRTAQSCSEHLLVTQSEGVSSEVPPSLVC